MGSEYVVELLEDGNVRVTRWGLVGIFSPDGALLVGTNHARHGAILASIREVGREGRLLGLRPA